jgi:RNA polymerase sigma-70 factor (ECF subfamily)
MHASHRLERVFSGGATTQVEQEDARLIQASQQGNQEAFATLLQKHQRRVFNMILRMVHDYDDASDVTQETFLAAWQGLPSFRGEARFSTWLYSIAYHCSLRQLERRKHEEALQTAMQAQQFPEGAQLEMRPEEMVEGYDMQARVREHLSQLPMKYRVVLILRHLQDRTYEEMAQILNLPIGTIKTHLFRARNLLKEHLLARQ